MKRDDDSSARRLLEPSNVRLLHGMIAVRALGEGRFGTNWAVRRPGSDERHFCCEISEDHATAYQAIIARVDRVNSVPEHPCLLNEWECLVDNGRLWIKTEYLGEAITLEQLVASEGQLSVAVACGIGLQIAHAIDHLHRHQSVHLAISPRNVLVMRDLRVYLTGHWQSCLSEDLDEEFLAPEQVGYGRVDHLADRYRLGATIYFALTGFPPFLFSRHRTQLQRRYQNLQGVPAELSVAIANMLCKSRSNRRVDAMDFHDICKQYATEEFSDCYATNERPELAPPAQPARSKKFWVGAMLAAFVVALVAFFLTWPQDPPIGTWVNVFESRRPRELEYSRAPRALDPFDSQTSSLTVVSEDMNFYPLSNLGREFELALEAKQLSWTGGFGLYFGDPASGNCWGLVTRIDGDVHRIDLVTYQLSKDIHGVFGNATFMKRVPVSPPGDREMRLSLHVSPEGEIISCTWGTDRIDELSGLMIGNRGSIGLLTDRTTVVFSDVRLKVLK